jgi:hypothetical protein
MMKRLVTGCVLAASLLFALAAPAGADPPTQVGPFEDTFNDVNPCTGLIHTVTIAATFSVHSHDGRIVAHGDRTLSTSSGFVGEGTSSFVDNGQIEMFRFTDILSSDSGDRIRANGVFVGDLSTGTVRVDKFELTCLGS